jgi:hypothetical protein
MANPNQVFCMLTGKIFRNPVRDLDGYVFEKEAIEHFVSDHWFHPVLFYDVQSPEHYTVEDDMEKQTEVKEFLTKNPTMASAQFIELDTRAIIRMKMLREIFADCHELNKKTSAYVSNHVELFKYLTKIQIKQFLTHQNQDLCSEPIKRIFECDTLVCHLFDTIGSDIDHINLDAMESKPIHLLLRYSPVETVKKILTKSNINMESKAKFGTKPIHLACVREEWDLVKFLVEKGVELTDTFGDVYIQQNLAHLVGEHLSEYWEEFQRMYLKKYGVKPEKVNVDDWNR